MRVGIGYDYHRLMRGRKLILGGVEIPHEKGPVGHSDGDVLSHAVCDALLGAAGLGDIGSHFPDDDPRWKDVSSLRFLSEVRDLLQANGWSLVNVDSTVVAEEPKLGQHFEAIRKSLAAALGIEAERVNVKAKTTEGQGEIGRGEAMAAQAVALLHPVSSRD